MTALFLVTLLSASAGDVDEPAASPSLPTVSQRREATILRSLRTPLAGLVAVFPCAVVVADGPSWPAKVAIGIVVGVVVLAVLATALGAGAWWVHEKGFATRETSGGGNNCNRCRN
ncbi:MAG: hypothetical protein HY904_16760 [Deltaproteobacteria bacterium]|nr:hypothetical protein [Deltaproteobacteria bacterium]